MSASVSIEDGKLLNSLQAGVPLVERPFAAVGEQVGMSENEVIGRVQALKEARIIRQIGAIFDSRSLGYRSSLVAAEVPADREDEAAAVLSRHPGVTHNYRRTHAFNLWFTIAVAPTSRLGLERTVEVLGREAGALATRLLPTLKLFKIGVKLDMTGEAPPDAQGEAPGYTEASRATEEISPEEIGVVRALQGDLPVAPSPFAEAAERLGLTQEALLATLTRMREQGHLRRIAAVLHHRQAGFRANAMGVWAVPEARVDEAGTTFSAYQAVSHCYQRPVYPDWPYSIFTMVHGRTPAECEATLEAMSKATGLTEYAALYSTKEYKKTRLSYFTPEAEQWEAEALERERAAGRAE